jgi:peptide/nickel transport system permease protein
MLAYIAKRVALFIPGMLVISLIGFFLRTLIPGDPTEAFLGSSAAGSEAPGRPADRKLAAFWREKLGLDKPLFYFSLKPLSACDTLSRIRDEQEREALDRLCMSYGNSSSAERFRKEVAVLEQLIRQHAQYLEPGAEALLHSLKTGYQETPLRESIRELKTYCSDHPLCLQQVGRVESSFRDLLVQQAPYRSWIPRLSFHSGNQFHQWLLGDGHWLSGKGTVHTRGIIRGDFGTSYFTRQPVMDMLAPRMMLSAALALVSLLIACLLSIPTGLYLAVNQHRKTGRILHGFATAVYALPVFFVATLLLLLFANPQVLDWFPPSGTGAGSGTEKSFTAYLSSMVLPVASYVYGSFIFLALVSSSSMQEVLKREFITTARAKGLADRQVLYRHALKNALFPLLTTAGNALPALIGGSVIVESIFALPGMGSLLLSAAHNQDYPVIAAVFTWAGFLTLAGFLLSDVLYCLFDPRVKERILATEGGAI